MPITDHAKKGVSRSAEFWKWLNDQSHQFSDPCRIKMSRVRSLPEVAISTMPNTVYPKVIPPATQLRSKAQRRADRIPRPQLQLTYPRTDPSSTVRKIESPAQSREKNCIATSTFMNAPRGIAA